MASRVQTAITFSSNASVTINNATPVTSDAFTFHADDWDAEVMVSANNDGAPASDDVCDVFIAYSAGDVLGDSGDDFATAEHAEFLFRLDTFASNTPGENPARRSARIRTGGKAFQLVLSCPNGALRPITARAMVNTHRTP